MWHVCNTGGSCRNVGDEDRELERKDTALASGGSPAGADEALTPDIRVTSSPAEVWVRKPWVRGTPAYFLRGCGTRPEPRGVTAMRELGGRAGWAKS